MSNPKIKLSVDLELDLSSEVSFSSVLESYNNVLTKINDGAQEGVEELGNMTQELMIANITANGNVKSGNFVNSIVVINDGLSFICGSNLNSIYPTVIEEGRGEIYPISAKCLHYVDDGKEYFVKKAGGYEGNPYVEPTAEAISNVARDVILNRIRTK